MEGFDKIRDVNLADLDEEHRLKDEIGDELSGGEPEKAGQNNEPEIIDESDPRSKAKIKDPVGKYYLIDADITEKELISFRLAHEYRRPSIILVNILAIVFIIFSGMRGSTSNMWIYAALAAFIIFYYPLTIFLRSRGLKKHNRVFQQIFHYMIDEAGLHLQLEGEAIDADWKYVRKIMVLKSCVVVYTGKFNAWIIPTKDMGDRKDEIIAFMKERVESGKN